MDGKKMVLSHSQSQRSNQQTSRSYLARLVMNTNKTMILESNLIAVKPNALHCHKIDKIILLLNLCIAKRKKIVV